MKKTFLLLFVVLMAVISIFAESSYTFVFNDGIINYREFSGKKFDIPKNYEIMWVVGAKSWRINESDDIIPFKIVELSDFKDKNLIEMSDNVYEIEGTSTIIFLNTKLNRWCQTDKKNYESLFTRRQLVIDSDKPVFIGLVSGGSWISSYEMFPDGKFIQKAEINGTPVGQTRLYLVRSNLSTNFARYENVYMMKNNVKASYQETAQMQQDAYDFVGSVMSDTFTLDLGNYDFNAPKISINLNSYMIKLFEDRYVAILNIYGYSGESRPTQIVRYFDNTDKNGIGIDMPAGTLWINELFDNKTFAIKSSQLSNTSKNEQAKIYMNSSWNVKYDVQILKDIPAKDGSRTTSIRVTFKNYSGEAKKARIELKQPSLQLTNYTVRNSQTKITNKSSTGNIVLEFDTNETATIDMDLFLPKMN